MIRPLPIRLIPACVILAACSDSPTSPDQADLQRGPAAVPAVSNSWVTRANLPSDERFGLTTAAVTNAAGQSVLYAIGGQTQAGGFLTRVQAYNVATNTWSNRAPLPRALHWTNGAGVINGKIYVSGGESGNGNFRDELLVYDPATNTWTEKSPMPTQGFRGVTGVIDGKLYVVTNCEQESCADFFAQALYRYNPATDRWTVLARPQFNHAWGFGGVIGGKFYVTGGATNALEVYDPTTNAWSTKASLPRRRWLGAGTALGGKLYVIGGFERKADGSIETLRRTSVYNPASDTWVLREPFPEAFISRSASRVSLNGKPRIHVVGGLRPGNNRAYIP